MTGGELVARVLKEAGVGHVFTLCGGHILPIYDGCGGRPGPVFVEIPVDLLLTSVEDRLAPVPQRYVHRTAPLADPDAVVRIAHLLSRAERPVVVAGSGVYWDDAAKALAAFAESAGVPVFMNGAGRGTLASDHPLAFAQARGFALASADFVLVLGAPLDPAAYRRTGQVSMAI